MQTEARTRSTYTDWQPEHARDWGTRPMRLAHPWHRDPLFEPQALARLIERYPREHYALVNTSTTGEKAGEGKRRWREGDIGSLSGEQVIEAISRGGLWLNLRNVHEVDARFGALLQAAHDELSARMPGFEPSALRMGILVSAPGAQVHYHADLPGQALWQISGRKRVYLWPAEAPYLTPEALERIALTSLEVGMTYDPAFDREATVFDLEPGQMLHWPLNAPHRIDNHDVLNISVTTEYWTPQIRRSQMVTLANGLLRQHLGITRASRSIAGPGFWAKAALQAAWRRSPWATRQRRELRAIDFKLSREAPGGWVELAPRNDPA
jgi:hypothetical protein